MLLPLYAALGLIADVEGAVDVGVQLEPLVRADAEEVGDRDGAAVPVVA